MIKKVKNTKALEDAAKEYIRVCFGEEAQNS